MPENLYNDVLGDLRIAWNRHHEWMDVCGMRNEWLKDLPNQEALIQQAFQDFQAEIKPFDEPADENANQWLHSWLDDEPSPATPQIATLRMTWAQALAHLEEVASKHDLTLAGNLEFNIASKQAVMARDDLYFAEVAASRQTVTA